MRLGKRILDVLFAGARGESSEADGAGHRVDGDVGALVEAANDVNHFVERGDINPAATLTRVVLGVGMWFDVEGLDVRAELA